MDPSSFIFWIWWHPWTRWIRQQWQGWKQELSISNDKYLYILAIIHSDMKVPATFKERNSPIYHHDSDFEVFVDPLGSCFFYKKRMRLILYGIWCLINHITMVEPNILDALLNLVIGSIMKFNVKNCYNTFKRKIQSLWYNQGQWW